MRFRAPVTAMERLFVSFFLLTSAAAESTHHHPVTAEILNDCDAAGGAEVAAQFLQYEARNVDKQFLANATAVENGSTPTAGLSDAAASSGVTGNKAENGPAFVSGLIINLIVIMVFICIFMQLRLRYPLTYSNNVKIGIAPVEALGKTAPEIKANLESRWGWYRASMNTTTEQVADTMGLDVAMLLEFTSLGRTILARVGVPMVLIIGPMNATFGGQPAWKQGDWLSTLSMGNVEHGVWLYWVHACMVWYVVLVVQVSLYGAQSRFIELRHRWLYTMSDKRANTIMVGCIPDEYRSDAKLKAFFGTILDDRNVLSAHVVKDTTDLCKMIDRNVAAERGLQETNAIWEKEGRAPEKRPSSWGKGDLIDYYSKEIEETASAIKLERARIKQASAAPGGVNTYSGFVTFKERKYAEIAAMLLYSSDRDEWEIEIPPEPLDIIWSDLQRSPGGQAGRSTVGVLAIIGLYFAYMPCVVGISAFCTSLNWGPLWMALAPTIGLQFMVAFLPTFLILIFQGFFTLKADAFAQKKLQVMYFWFQIVFVVLITAIGDSVLDFTKTVFTDPLALPAMLGETMPHATHFYLNFMVLQWVTHVQNMLRYVMLFKFFSFSALYDEEDARKMSEPEDQDYYGMGSRSARFTINLVLGVVYGTLAPLMNILCWGNFFACRVVYGYLIPFAETKKPDLGGEFWVDQLKHVFVGNIIYVVVMIGVLGGRAEVTGPVQPAGIAGLSLLYVVWSMRRFERAFSWEKLPITAVLVPAKVQKPMAGEYFQPELAG